VDTTEVTACPGCDVRLPVSDWPAEPKRHASPACLEVAGELLGFEVEHQAELGHLHQLRIDAYGAQHCGPDTPAIGTVFALNGLYMYFERGSGNLDVRTAHSVMADSGTSWPKLTAPPSVGGITAYDVVVAIRRGASVGDVERLMIEWADTAWNAWPESDRELIRDLTVATVPERYFRR
jgi:Family of unknown function (DUF5946)